MEGNVQQTRKNKMQIEKITRKEMLSKQAN